MANRSKKFMVESTVYGKQQITMDQDDYAKIQEQVPSIYFKLPGGSANDPIAYLRDNGREIPLHRYILDEPSTRVKFKSVDHNDLRRSNLLLQ